MLSSYNTQASEWGPLLSQLLSGALSPSSSSLPQLSIFFSTLGKSKCWGSPEGILMCSLSPSPSRQLLALQRDRHWVLSWFFGMEAVLFGVGATHMHGTPWHNKHLVHEQDKAKLVPPSHVGLWLCLHCLQTHPGAIFPFSLSPQGQARRTAPPAPPRALQPTGAVSPPAVRVSTPPTATGCPTKSARGTEPPEQSQG